MKPSWPITPVSLGVVSLASGTLHYYPDVLYAMSNFGLSGPGQWMHLRVPFFLIKKKKNDSFLPLNINKKISIIVCNNFNKIWLFYQ
jgi:hypothetical protein